MATFGDLVLKRTDFFTDATGTHPIRDGEGYSGEKAGDPKTRGTSEDKREVTPAKGEPLAGKGHDLAEAVKQAGPYSGKFRTEAVRRWIEENYPKGATLANTMEAASLAQKHWGRSSGGMSDTMAAMHVMDNHSGDYKKIRETTDGGGHLLGKVVDHP